MDFSIFISLYCQIDTRITADVCIGLSIENFKQHGLHISSCVSISQFAYNIFLQSTEEKLEILTSDEIWAAFANPIAGVVDLAARRYVSANRIDVPKCYQSGKRSQFLLVMDATALYNSSLTFSHATKNFRILSEQETEKMFYDITENLCYLDWCDEYAFEETGGEKTKKFGLTLIIDVAIGDDSLHSLLDSYPLFPTREVVPDEYLSS